MFTMEMSNLLKTLIFEAGRRNNVKYGYDIYTDEFILIMSLTMFFKFTNSKNMPFDIQNEFILTIIL